LLYQLSYLTSRVLAADKNDCREGSVTHTAKPSRNIYSTCRFLKRLS